MDTISESGERSENFKKNESQEPEEKICNENENLPENPLLYLFVQYAWNPRHGACYVGHEYKKLERLLETAELRWDNSIVYRDLENRLCSFKKPRSVRYNEDFEHNTRDTKDMEIFTHVVYKLRSLITTLNRSKGDVNYESFLKRTVLHIFLCECLNIRTGVPEDQICRIRIIIKSLIEMGAMLYVRDWYGQTPLHAAALCKNQQILQTMISSLVDAEKYDQFGNTALHIIVDSCVDKKGNHKDGYVDFIRTLVSKGANINAKNSDGMTPVHLAASKFQADMLKLFADEGANFNECTNDGHTLLQIACKSTFKLRDSSKIMETFDFLIAQGCDVAVLNNEGHTLLHYAAEFQIAAIVERLITLGVKVDCRTNKTLLTPLYLAAKNDKLYNMKTLVRAGADVNAEAADGTTPIFMSAMLGSYGSMQFLIAQGADLHRRDSLMGFTLLHVAANDVNLRLKTRGNQTEEQRNKKLKKLEVLLEKGLNVNDTGTCGVTPLQLAALAPNFDAVKLLLDRGAELDLQTSQWTALHVALLLHDLEIVKMLLARGADVHRRGGTGHWSPIHLALVNRSFAVGCHPKAIDKNDVRFSCPIRKLWGCKRPKCAIAYGGFLALLVKNGADVNVQNAFGETPLHLAGPDADHLIVMLRDADAHANVQDRKGRLPLHDTCNSRDDVALKLLLNFGADINDDDSSEMIVNSRNELKHIAIRHAIKLELVGLPVAKVYKPLINGLEYTDFREKCAKEATELMNHRDADGFSLYKFLRMNPKFQYHYIKKISREYKNLEQMFPMYAGLIRGACRESAIRRQLLESARIVWAENSGIYLPDVCVERILSYLSNRYLKVLVTTFEKITNIEDGRIAFKIEI